MHCGAEAMNSLDSLVADLENTEEKDNNIASSQLEQTTTPVKVVSLPENAKGTERPSEGQEWGRQEQ